ncbi:MAG: DEAD/DEAH box helicase [Trueperaceae bacterium]
MSRDPNESFHAFLTQLDEYQGQVASYTFFPPRKGVFAPEDDGPFAAELARLGVVPFRHQARALRAAGSGRDVVVATPTASGKSLTFQLPAVAAAVRGQTTLLLYPTKALAHDQLLRFGELADALGLPAAAGEGVPTVAAYDGDTPAERRAGVRAGTRIVLTNPDMLHYGILPHHRQWASFLGALRYLVLDELHAYRGVLGTHVANVVRRLLRMAARYGADPVVIAASATVGNPGEHAERLTGRPFEVIDEGDAPSGAREFVIWRPPAVGGRQGGAPDAAAAGERRRSSNGEAAQLAAAFARHGVKSLFFCNSRKAAELIRRYAVGMVDPELAPTIQSYRAGYTAEDRRLLEAGFRDGDIRVLTATSALELGVDVGGVDAVVMVGYPGSKMALWQRSGRAGREGGRALTLLVPGADPLDEYFLHHPDALVDGPVERAVADPFNDELHPLHVACAAAEAPVAADEPWLAPWLDLSSVPSLVRAGGTYRHVGRYPHRRVHVRGGGGRQIRLKDGMGRSLGSTDFATALRELHPGAVHLHQGEPYLVAELDLERGLARLLPHIEDYYTQPRSETDIEVLGPLPSRPQVTGVLAEPPPGVHVGRVRVRHVVTGFVKKRYVSEAVLDERPLDLPEVTYDTQAAWFEVDGVPGAPAGEELPASLHALEHTLIQLLPAFVLCERADVGGVSYPFYPPTGRPTVFVYDGHPGGVGYARAGAAAFLAWLTAARDLLHACPCVDGCPRCVLSPKCGNGNQMLDKHGAARLADALLDHLRVLAPGVVSA